MPLLSGLLPGNAAHQRIPGRGRSPSGGATGQLGSIRLRPGPRSTRGWHGGYAVNGQTTALAKADLLSTTAVVRRLPTITYRQLDYWHRIRAITPTAALDLGSGFYRGWSERDVDLLLAIGDLHRALVPAVANQISTDLVRAAWRALGATGRFDLSDPPIEIHLRVRHG